MELDIFKPIISKVLKGLEGRAILLYGDNGTGKTTQAVSGMKPFYFPFDPGLSGIDGIRTLPIFKWSDFMKMHKQFTNPKTLVQAKEVYQTIVFDGVKDAAELCQRFVCSKIGVSSMTDDTDGAGNTWLEYEKEFKSMLRSLLQCGYTVIFIAHEETRKVETNGEAYSKTFPNGDKRSIKPISNMCDVIVYLINEGDGSDGDAKSTGYLGASRNYHSKARGLKITPVIKDFTLAKLADAVDEAVALQEKEKTGSTISFKENARIETEMILNRSAEELQELIKPIAKNLINVGKAEEYAAVCDKYLGKGKRVSEAKKTQSEQLELILIDLQDISKN